MLITTPDQFTGQSPPPFHAAIYICADCGVEHNGDDRRLPAGWNRVAGAADRASGLRCPDCLTSAAISAASDFQDRPAGLTSHSTRFGIAAAAFTGRLA